MSSPMNGSSRREFGSPRPNFNGGQHVNGLIDLTIDSNSESGPNESEELVFVSKARVQRHPHPGVISQSRFQDNGIKGHQAIVIDSSPPHALHIVDTIPSSNDGISDIDLDHNQNQNQDLAKDKEGHIGVLGTGANQRTPNGLEWTTGKIVRALEERTLDLERLNQDLAAYTIKSVVATEKRILKGTDWFANVKHEPVPAEAGNTDMIKIKVKHHGRSKKEQRTFHFMPICIKTDRARVPKYRFHHKEIARNVLTPNTMLKFVPHIRDLEANEERNYNLWLKELERMDASCGFQPMGTREQRVIRTTKKERTTMLALYLDYWLEKLAIADCTRSTLIRHMASSQSDMAITPQQKSSLFGLHRGNGPADTPQAARSAKMFTEAFDRVFHDGVSPDKAVSLQDILLLDKSVDDIVESKKTAKNTTQEDDRSTEAFVETYAIMGCLICYSNSCEHGDYGENNEKRNFSLDCNGRLEQLFTKDRDADEKSNADQTIIEPSDCCAYKFTGCACSGSGKTCQQRQCICVQLNRECDPQLCGTCGVTERAHPDNRDNEAIMETGCQNCMLQRGDGKAVTPGKSQLDGCGYGLFTLEDIAQHDFVIEYTGELIMHDEGVRREARRGEVFDEGSFTSYVFSLLDSEGIWVDAAIYGNHSRYINHEQDTYNVEPKIIYVNGEYRIRFSATRNIQAGEELFFNYGNNFPNLTKKMIKDKTAEEDGPTASESQSVEPMPVKKTRGQGSTRGHSRGGGRGRGRGVGRGRGRGRVQMEKPEAKPVKRGRPSARKEAPQMPEEANLAMPSKGRKRKRDPDDDSEEEDYQPTMEEESEDKTDSLGTEEVGDLRGRGGPRRRGRQRLRSSSEDDDDNEISELNTPTRGRGRPRQSVPVPVGWQADEDSERQVTPQPKRRGRPPKKATLLARLSGNTVPPKSSPSKRGGRTTKPLLSERLPSRGRDEADGYVDDHAAEADADDGDAEEGDNDTQTTPTPILRTRRSLRLVVADSDDELPTSRDGYVDEDSIGSRPSGGRSDSRSRRERKMPARYRDREQS
ncbi:hypothetical protein ACHAQA_000377 [Verticillium albo-atrum]